LDSYCVLPKIDHNINEKDALLDNVLEGRIAGNDRNNKNSYLSIGLAYNIKIREF